MTGTERSGPPIRPGGSGPARRNAQEAPAPRRREWLSEALLEMSRTRPGWRTLDFLLSLLFHTVIVTTLVLLPLYFTEAIDLKHFTQTMLVAPPPPPPPPPAAPLIAKRASAPRRVFSAGGKLIAPTVIPTKAALLKEEELPPETGELGVIGGVPGGIPGGHAGGVIGGILSSAPRTYIPAAPALTAKAPIRVGGQLKSPRALYRPGPVYPLLAKAAKLEGDVVIDAVIDAQGNIAEMHVVSGHPLFIPAAMDALGKWKYEPTILNDQPWPVKLLVTIRFRLM